MRQQKISKKERVIFNKKISNKFTIKQAGAALLVAAIILFIHNFNFAIDRFDKFVLEDFSLTKLGKFFFEFGLHFFLLFTFFFFCSFNKIIFRSAAFILLLLSTIFAFIYNKFGILIDQATIANALDNSSEITSLVDFTSLLLYLISFLILPFAAICYLQIIRGNNKKNFITIAVIFTLFAAALSGTNQEIRKGTLISYSPISLIDSTYAYFTYTRPSLKNRETLKPINKIISDAKNNPKKINNLKVVLIIGESARSQNFSLDGYERKTNPELEKIQHLINFKDVKTGSNLTSYAVSAMLSYKTAQEFSFEENSDESVIKLFENLGFTTAWFSTQKAVGDDNALLILAMQAQKYFFGNSVSKKVGGSGIFDGYLLDFLDKEIANSKDNFVILQTQGSHFLFDERYPDEFRKFTPTCKNRNPSDCVRQELVNAYDNSILYTDYFISQVINRLKNENAIVFYVSDHGQFLGEKGIYYHGNNGDFDHDEHKVPMFLWMSDSVRKNKFYQKKFSNAQLKSGAKLSHDNIFDSLLECSGVDSKFFDRNLSLCKN